MADEVTAGEGTPETGAGQNSPTETPETTQSDAEGTTDENTTVDTPEGDTEAPEGAESAEGGEEAPQGAPESYGEFKFPEGVTASEGDLKSFHELAKELDLSQEQAQKLVDLETQRMGDMQKAQQEAVVKHLEGVKTEWVEGTKKAWGDDFDAKAADAVRASEVGSDEFRDLLNGRDPKLPGVVLADHPAVAEFLATVGAQMKEAPFAKSGSGAKSKGVADTLYGTVDVQAPD